MKDDNLRSMSVDELWALYEVVLAQLDRRIATERDLLETRLRRLGAVSRYGELRRARRPYSKVLAKYRNPKNHSETWAGRGKQPRWLVDEIRSGKKLADFLIG
ncbi:MAG TPA: H-NS histone family protein [Bryobacteraceae bacterium]|jgi:DNA-binding protein H-NS|nr:H-NS histone family protein [Bryobacteraceae bacterium]